MQIVLIHCGSLWFKNEPRGRTAVHHGLLYSKDSVFYADSKYDTHRYLNSTSTLKKINFSKISKFKIGFSTIT